VDRPDEREVAEEMQRQRAARAGDVAAGDPVLLLAAGTGYTWGAAVVRW
jgi:3-oxoacyl-[acyl-carrier-protein] synthase III